MLSDKDMRERMNKGWRGGIADGTVCGQGSTLANTAIIREWLPEMVHKYEIQSVADAGAGDLHWTPLIDWNVEYLPFDLIPRSRRVKKHDITRRKLPVTDAILCRMVLNHLGDGDDYSRVEKALGLFKKSAKYLFATHFIDGGPRRTEQFMRLDLTEWLGEPLEMCRDGHEDNCRLALWRL